MNSDRTSSTFGRCADCGGTIKLKTGPGRTREYLRGVWLAIPDDFGTPACTNCGAEYMAPEVSEQLDELLRQRLTAHVNQCATFIQVLHGVSQQEIEDALGITRSYLSHLRAGRKEPSGALVKLLELCAIIPECFQHVREQRPLVLSMPGLFVVGAGKLRSGSGFRALRAYGSTYEGPTQQPSERLSA